MVYEETFCEKGLRGTWNWRGTAGGQSDGDYTMGKIL